MTSEVRVRVAPSPTGMLHIGTARTTLVNWLYARKFGGRLILRLEDTDADRSLPQYEQDIIDNLRWLGLHYDEGPDVGGDFGPYRQSERMRERIYEPYLQQLMDSGNLYPCYCTPDELKAHRRKVKEHGRTLEASSHCRCFTLSKRQKARLESQGRKPAWRFRVPDTVVEFTDLVHGEQVFDMNQVDDFILVDSKANALFLLSNVIDDHTMQLNPVIRGEDHLPNTPRQILIYRALGLPIPEFGHLPLILNPDGTKMSKRSGGTVVQEYRERGFLPEALNNYLALLGWTPAENREIFALDELVELFELERLSDSPSRFDSQKLNWLNNQWIQKLETEDLASRFLPFLSRDGLVGSPPSDREKDLVHQVAPLVQQRVHTLEEVSKWMRPFLEHPSGIRFQMFPDNMSSAEIRQLLAETRRCLTLTEPFDADSIRIDLDQLVTSLGYSKRRLFMCIRIAVTGSRVSPPLYESLEILGRGVVLKRLERAEDELD